MEELAGQASLRDAGTTAGIATDKLLALSGEPALTIQHDLTLRPFNANDLYERLAQLQASIKSKTIEAAVVEPVTSQAALPNGETRARLAEARKQRWPGAASAKRTSAQRDLSP